MRDMGGAKRIVWVVLALHLLQTRTHLCVWEVTSEPIWQLRVDEVLVGFAMAEASTTQHAKRPRRPLIRAFCSGHRPHVVAVQKRIRHLRMHCLSADQIHVQEAVSIRIIQRRHQSLHVAARIQNRVRRVQRFPRVGVFCPIEVVDTPIPRCFSALALQHIDCSRTTVEQRFVGRRIPHTDACIGPSVHGCRHVLGEFIASLAISRSRCGSRLTPTHAVKLHALRLGLHTHAVLSVGRRSELASLDLQAGKHLLRIITGSRKLVLHHSRGLREHADLHLGDCSKVTAHPTAESEQ
mmetsp:Transcript_59971/g.172130  ORF Transcript_59971/g.172130 Transcript_59971/m.172130 type:complete len:295 (+) Transcript_59971:134-1018(+)